MWVDFHVHTRRSRDSMASPKDVVKSAVRKGLRAIAITDHNEVKGIQEVKEEVRRLGADLMVIPGEEVKTARGDVIGLFISERIPKGMDISETVDRIREQGGLVMVPHPFDRKMRGALGDAILDILGKIDYIEVLNGRTPSWNNRKAEEFAKRYGIPGLGGSDAHWPGEIGKVRTLVARLDEGKIEPIKVEGDGWPPIIFGVLYSSIAKAFRIL